MAEQKIYSSLFQASLSKKKAKFFAERTSTFMLYFKELLKDEQKQLRDYTLLIPYFGTSDKNSTPLEYFFFPSPQILRYSQNES